MDDDKYALECSCIGEVTKVHLVEGLNKEIENIERMHEDANRIKLKHSNEMQDLLDDLQKELKVRIPKIKEMIQKVNEAPTC
ncbi:hypothetical protein LCGC14_2207260 [marine sediment metagenome]|uniref:Uncharacterized protein n=1 Tax=marine sediment metagenome TaxID=412755 RepID=A0A0F9FS88_9ZZZZ